MPATYLSARRKRLAGTRLACASCATRNVARTWVRTIEGLPLRISWHLVLSRHPLLSGTCLQQHASGRALGAQPMLLSHDDVLRHHDRTEPTKREFFTNCATSHFTPADTFVLRPSAPERAAGCAHVRRNLRNSANTDFKQGTVPRSSKWHACDTQRKPLCHAMVAWRRRPCSRRRGQDTVPLAAPRRPNLQVFLDSSNAGLISKPPAAGCLSLTANTGRNAIPTDAALHRFCAQASSAERPLSTTRCHPQRAVPSRSGTQPFIAVARH